MSDKKPVVWWDADEAKEIADELITAFHKHLEGEAITYVFRSQHAEAKGKVVLGMTKKITGLNAYLALRRDLGLTSEEDDAPAPFYCIEFAWDMWIRMDGKQRIALVDHELSHITPDGLRGHDIEEFSAIARRHGAWKQDLADFKAAINEKPVFEAAREAISSVGEKIMDDLSNPNSKAAKAMKPKKGSGISSVTISAGGRSVTLKDDGVH